MPQATTQPRGTQAAPQGGGARRASPPARRSWKRPPPRPNPQAPTAREVLDRARALGIHRERDLYRRAHELGSANGPANGTPRARLALAAALAIWEAKP